MPNSAQSSTQNNLQSDTSGGPVQSKYTAVRLAALLGCAVVMLLFIYSVPAWPQTADEVEKRIASLPPGQRVYERFRFWVTTLQPDQQRDPNLPARYREYLRTRGFSDSDADAQ